MWKICSYLKGLVFITATLTTASLTLFTSSHLNALFYHHSSLTWLLAIVGLALAPISFIHMICQKHASSWRPKVWLMVPHKLQGLCKLSKPSSTTTERQPDDVDDSQALEKAVPLWAKVAFGIGLITLPIMVGLELGSLVLLGQGHLNLVRSFAILPSLQNVSGSSCFCRAGSTSLHVDNPSGCHFTINGHFCMANYHGGTSESDKVDGNPPCQMSSAIGSQSLNRECLLYRLFERMVWPLGILMSVVIICQFYLMLHWTCRPSFFSCAKFKTVENNPIEPETLTNRSSTLDQSKFATITSRQRSRSALASLTSLPNDFFPAKEEIELSENPLTLRGKEDHDQEVFLISPNSKIVPIKQSQSLHRLSSGRRMTLADLPGSESVRDSRKLRRLRSFGHGGGPFDEDLKNDIGSPRTHLGIVFDFIRLERGTEHGTLWSSAEDMFCPLTSKSGVLIRYEMWMWMSLRRIPQEYNAVFILGQ